MISRGPKFVLSSCLLMAAEVMSTNCYAKPQEKKEQARISVLNVATGIPAKEAHINLIDIVHSFIYKGRLVTRTALLEVSACACCVAPSQ
jgi:hypothetical protein